MSGQEDSRVEMELLHERLLSSEHRVVEGPADLYFIPVSMSFISSESSAQHLLDALQWLAQAHPFWNATGGARHLIVVTGDRGQCQLNNGPHEAVEQLNALLTHVTFVQVC